GLQSVGEEAADFVPWAWGINGCLSVYGSVVAILAAMVYGFTATLVLGAVAYAGAFLAARWFAPRSGAAVAIRALAARARQRAGARRRARRTRPENRAVAERGGRSGRPNHAGVVRRP